MDARPDKVCRSGQEQSKDGLEQFWTDKLFQLIFVILEAFDYPRNTQAALFDDFLIAAAENIEQHGHNVPDDRERVFRNVATAIGSGGYGGALRTCGEEVEISQTGCEPSLSNDGCWELDRDLL